MVIMTPYLGFTIQESRIVFACLSKPLIFYHRAVFVRRDPSDLPEMSGTVPNHLLLLQGQSLNHSFAVINKLAVQGLLH